MPTRIPWRSDAGTERPVELPLPGAAPMPLLRGRRPLKRWRYVGVYSQSLMLCAAQVRIGPARQSFWAVWDGERLRERTRVLGRHGAVDVSPGALRVRDGEVEIDLRLDEDDGVESVCPNGEQYVWTRKQGGVRARGRVRLGDAAPRAVDERAVIDDTAGYHARRTAWLWCAGVGRSEQDQALAWNLVAGVNDPESGSERTVWVDGTPREVAPVAFAGLDAVRFDDGEELRFEASATRARRENLLVLRSDYVQPFGVFSGTLAGGVRLAEGHGVMERHDVRW